METEHDTPAQDPNRDPLERFEIARDAMLDALDVAEARIIAELRQARADVLTD
jgi:hypothetical protein